GCQENIYWISACSLVDESAIQVLERGGDLVTAGPACQFALLVQEAVGSETAPLENPQPSRHVVIDEPQRAAQLAERVEVSHQRHIRISLTRRCASELSRGPTEHGGIYAHQTCLD